MSSHSPLLQPACVSCLIKKQIDRYPASAPREQVLTYMRRLGQMMSALPDRTGGPEIMEAITPAIKRHFNALMMETVATHGLFETVMSSSDPLRAALGYAMTGNFIDFGAMDSVDEGKLRALLEESPHRVSPDLPA